MYLYTHIHSSTTPNSHRWKEPVSITEKWISKLIYVHIMDYYSASKGKGVLAHATTRMNLKDVTLSEISQSQKDK